MLIFLCHGQKFPAHGPRLVAHSYLSRVALKEQCYTKRKFKEESSHKKRSFHKIRIQLIHMNSFKNQVPCVMGYQKTWMVITITWMPV